jgi:hypothetical protein
MQVIVRPTPQAACRLAVQLIIFQNEPEWEPYRDLD